MMYGMRQWAYVSGLLGYKRFILVALQYNETSDTMQMNIFSSAVQVKATEPDYLYIFMFILHY